MALTNFISAIVSAGGGGSNNNAEWLSVETDPYEGLLSSDGFTYTGFATISTVSSNVVLDVHDHPDNWFLVVRMNESNTTKTKSTNTGTLNIDMPIPGITFPHGVLVARGFKYYISNDAQFNHDPSSTLILST